MKHSDDDLNNTIRALEHIHTMLERVEEKSIHILVDEGETKEEDGGMKVIEALGSANQQSVSYLKYGGRKGK